MNITTGKVAKAQKVVLYGPEGIGKSTFASQFPDPLFIDTEGSTHNMDVPRMDRPTSWNFLHQQVEWVKNNRPCKSLIIDTIDWAERLGIDFITSRGNKTSITSFGYGDGFIQLEEEFGKFLNKLSDLVEIGINVVLTAHSKIVRFEAPDEMGAYDRYELKLGNKTTAKTAGLTKEWADMILFLNYKVFSVATDDKGTRFKGQGGTRTMYATHHPAWDAKNRHELPDEMPMDYAQIAHIFEQQPTATDPIPTQPLQEPLEQTLAQPVAEPVAPVQQETQTEPSGNTGQLENEQSFEGTEKVGINHTGINGDYAPQEIASDLDPSIPQSLRDLMTQNNVSVEEIQIVVGDRGYYPMETPIVNYDPQFIDGVLVGAWNQVFSQIKEIREKTPF